MYVRGIQNKSIVAENFSFVKTSNKVSFLKGMKVRVRNFTLTSSPSR